MTDMRSFKVKFSPVQRAFLIPIKHQDTPDLALFLKIEKNFIYEQVLYSRHGALHILILATFLPVN
jgi:hypothetical protein